MSKTITFSLNNVRSISRAISEVKKFREDVADAIGALVQKLTEDGKEFAQFELLRMFAFDTGELTDNVHFTVMGDYNAGMHTGIIATNTYYAVFVEYGTGVVGENFHHPNPIGWEYDYHHHGDEGWYYFDHREGRKRWTKGYKARPFMYNTHKELQRIALSVANEVLSQKTGG